MPKELERINKYYLRKVIQELYRDKFIKNIREKDGYRQIVLTTTGKKELGRIKTRSLIVQKQAIWDKQWRVVFYDIPEKYKQGRNMPRDQLKILGFCELQKSVWVYPYPCKEVIQHLIDFYDMNTYVRYAAITEIDNDKKLRRLCKL